MSVIIQSKSDDLDSKLGILNYKDKHFHFLDRPILIKWSPIFRQRECQVSPNCIESDKVIFV